MAYRFGREKDNFLKSLNAKRSQENNTHMNAGVIFLAEEEGFEPSLEIAPY